MVSDFIEEASGEYFWHEDKQARLLETQTDGYFDSDKFLLQVDEAIDIFEAKYPTYQGLFVFDNAPSHKKCPDDALRVENMNVCLTRRKSTGNEEYSVQWNLADNGSP